MAPKKKEHSNDLRTLVIRHYQNGDSLSEIAAKALPPLFTAETESESRTRQLDSTRLDS